MLDFQFHPSVATLRGTCYNGLLPGRFAGSRWNPDSRFIDERTFFFADPAIKPPVPAFSHYSFFDVSRPRWEWILSDRKKLESAWQATLTNGCPENVEVPFDPNRNLRRMSQEDTGAKLTASIACLAAATTSQS